MEELRPVYWIRSSKRDLKSFPEEVQDVMGFGLYMAQVGEKHISAKRLKGMGSGVMEIVENHDGDTYRAIYTVRFKRAVYMLHAFQKKAKRGIATPKEEMELVRRRLRDAEAHYDEHYGGD